MKKTLLSLTIAVMSLTAFSVSAQNNKCSNADCPKNKCVTAQCNRQKQKCDKMFAGIELTADQKAKLAALQEECQKAKADCKKMKGEHKEKIKGERRQMRHQRDSIMRDAKVKRLAEIKKILTPEQYTQFLENMAMNKDMKAPKHHRGHHHGKKVGKPHKGCSVGSCPATK